MAENIVIPNSYYIINRVLSPSGVKLAVQYDGLDKKLTLAALDEANPNQIWVLDGSLEKSTTVVPLISKDQQAAPRKSDDSFVFAEIAVQPHLWVFKDGDGIIIPIRPPPPLQDIIIEELGKPQPAPGEPAPEHGRIWGAEKATPGDEVTLKYDHHGFAQRWVLQHRLVR